MDKIDEFQLRLQNIEFLSTTMYSGIILLLVIDGELVVETNSEFYQMKENDLLVINRNQLYQVRGTKKNVVLALSIPDSFIYQYYEEYHHYRFDLFSQQIDRGKESIISELRKLLAELTITYCRQDEGYQLEIHGSMCKILLTLIRRFKEVRKIFVDINQDEQRLKQIVTYLEQHYDEPLTLEQVSNKFYLSPSYFSRYFKQQFGIGFMRYLMNIRLEHSVKDLMFTTDSITFISLKNGFPNAKSFANLFKEVYGETPHSFRDKNRQKQVNVVESYQLQDTETFLGSPEILMKLDDFITEGENLKSFSTETRFEELKIDLGSINGRILNHPNNIIMIGELNELQKENVRTQVLLANKKIQVKYIGIHKLLSGKTISQSVETDELIPTISPYYNADEVIYFMKTNDLSLFIQVDYKEVSLDEKAYLLKLQSFLMHCLQMFGRNYVGSWKFLFFATDDVVKLSEPLEEFYLKLHKLLKTIEPSIEVGIFLPFSFQTGTTNEKHKWALHQREKIDFITFQASPNEIIDFRGLVDHNYVWAKDFIKEKTEKLKNFLKSYCIEKPLCLLTWNTISGNTRYTNGTFFRGALILNDAINVADDVESLGFWINTETHEQNIKGKNIPLEGMELFHYFTGKRPVFYAMSFFKRLQGKVIAKGPYFIMTENDLGYQMVIMNCNIVNPYFSVEETFLQKLMKELRVTIKGFPRGEYQIRKYVFDQEHGALYKKWWENNSKYGIDREIIDYITRVSQPYFEVFDEIIDENWSFYSYLSINAIHFYEIRKVFI
jgi:beta-xylosidase/AraC-like DNA-binding protein